MDEDELTRDKVKKAASHVSAGCERRGGGGLISRSASVGSRIFFRFPRLDTSRLFCIIGSMVLGKISPYVLLSQGPY